MDLVELLFAEFGKYLPILVRISSFLLAVPIFGQGVPPLAKVGLAGAMTLLVAPGVPPIPPAMPQGGYTLLIVEEVAIGLAMGLVVTMIISAIYFAGQLIDVPIGFSMVNVVDPQTGMQVPLMAQFKFALAILVLFVVNGHHPILSAIAQSFQVVPFGAASLTQQSVDLSIRTFGTMFVLALRISLPLVAALFVTDIALGIVARTVPQINVFFIGIPLKIALGFALLTLVIPVFVMVIAGLFREQGEIVRSLWMLMRSLVGEAR